MNLTFYFSNLEKIILEIKYGLDLIKLAKTQTLTFDSINLS